MGPPPRDRARAPTGHTKREENHLTPGRVDRGARLVGIDSLNVDDTADPRRPAHTELLRAGVPVVEHLTHLEAVPEHGFRFFAVPVKVRALGTFPVRAFCLVAPDA